MSLKNLVTTKATGTFGTFEVVDGNVSKNRKPILQFFNGTTALVPMDARSSFTTPEEHAAFDATLMGLSVASAHIQYVDSIGKFMDPKARFTDWLNGKLTPHSVGINLTAEELAVPTAYESAKAKFIAMFTAPKPAREFDPRELTEAKKLVVGNRLGKPSTVGNGSYTMTYLQAQRLWVNHLNKAWAGRPYVEDASRVISRANVSAGGYNDRTVEVYANRVTIGCQTIQRNQIEELAQRMNWDMNVPE